MGDILTARSISRKYNPNSDHQELKNVYLNFQENKIYLIRGKSGSGKTTLLNILGGMSKPDTGSVNYKQRSIYDLSEKEQALIRNKSFGFVFQSFNLIPELSAKENILLPKYFNPKLTLTDRDVKDLSDELAIGSLLHKEVYLLSGGEQQRVAIARALITQPDIIFADEPTGNLDSTNSSNVFDLLMKSVLVRKATLLMVTHENRAIQYPHENLFIRDGVVEQLEEGVERV
ncbi:ABC transporter ATP-binding protein [Paenibacillus xylaniclasticus]|uniref:ABC transporter ATP-binding protein n=1 Tax=Paenibacillus xylaniclasticus TaxID=588083 RepID=UPI000FD756D5|nr:MULTISPECIES: ABC transporter ATP-binding protein [Paenibacillus]GFN33791.1 ABC transporter ATP-binding protein [Paenibacillus curdlanolyticus]